MRSLSFPTLILSLLYRWWLLRHWLLVVLLKLVEQLLQDLGCQATTAHHIGSGHATHLRGLISRDFVLLILLKAIVPLNLMQHLAARYFVRLGHDLLARRATGLLLVREVVGSLRQLLIGVVDGLILAGFLMDDWLSVVGECWLLSMGLLTGDLLRLLLMLDRLLILLVHIGCVYDVTTLGV